MTLCKMTLRKKTKNRIITPLMLLKRGHLFSKKLAKPMEARIHTMKNSSSPKVIVLLLIVRRQLQYRLRNDTFQ